jgi:hypothetical protein
MADTLKAAGLPVTTVRLAGFVRMTGAITTVSVATELVTLPDAFVIVTK